MKVIHVASALSWRGGEQQVYNLFQHLASKNISQKLICSKGSVIAERFEANGWDYHAIKKSGGFDLSFAKRLSNTARDYGADIVHLHDAHSHTSAVLAGLFFGLNSTFVLSRRVDFPVKNSWLSKFKYNYHQIKKILCVSNTILEITKPSINDKTKLKVVYSGINLERFSGAQNNGLLHREFNWDENVKIVGNTAALADQKDYPTFLRTAKHFKNDAAHVKFVIMGEGPDRKRIEEIIENLRLQEIVTITGFRKDLPELLAEFDVFFMPSKTEGLGTSLFDAMACGLPIVATRAGGIPEIVEHEKNGLLGEVGNDVELAGYIRQLLADKEKRQKFIDAGKAKLNIFSSEKMAEETYSVYQDLIL